MLSSPSNHFLTKLNIQKLCVEALTLDYIQDGSGAKMAFVPSGGIPELKEYPEIALAVKEISDYREQKPLHLMINILMPSVTVPIHRDWITPTQYQKENPTVERWHLPVMTNTEAIFWDEESGTRHLVEGMWYGPIKYWIQHQIWNHGTKPRIHIVVDLNTSERQGEYAP